MSARAKFRKDGRRAVFAAVSLAMVLATVNATAQEAGLEIKPFGQLDSGASVVLRYNYASYMFIELQTKIWYHAPERYSIL